MGKRTAFACIAIALAVALALAACGDALPTPRAHLDRAIKQPRRPALPYNGPKPPRGAAGERERCE